MPNQNTQEHHIIPETFILSPFSLADFFSSENSTAVELLSILLSCLTSPRCSFVRFIPCLIIHGGNTFRLVLAVSDLIFSLLSSPAKATSTCQD